MDTPALEAKPSTSKFMIVKHDWETVLNHKEELVSISRAAFARPPWRLNCDFEPLLSRLIELKSDFFCALSDNASVHGFSVGLRICRQGQLPLVMRLAAEGDYYLVWRAVSPEYRGKGMGQALTLARINYAISIGARNIWVDTKRANFGTVNMYKRLGFMLVDEQLECVDRQLSSRVFMRICSRGLSQ